MDQTLLYILVILMVGILMLSLAVVIMYIRVTRKYVNLRTAGVGDKDDTIIGNAKAIAEKIVEDAKKKSKQMLDESQVISGKYAENIDIYVQQAINNYLQNFTKTLQDTENKMLSGMSSISEGVSNVVNQDIANVRQALSNQLQKMENDISGEVNKTFSGLEMELASYKKMRMKQIDTAIFDIVEEVARKVLEKEINAEEHEKLVLKALDEAKKQNLFLEGDENAGLPDKT